MLIANAYVVDGHGCENLVSVNISVLCPCVCVRLSLPVNITSELCIKKWEESQ